MTFENTLCILVGLLAGALITRVVLTNKKDDKDSNADMIERLGRFENTILESVNNRLSQDSDRVNQTMRNVMENVNTKMSQDSDKVNETMQNVIARLATIDKAQSQMQDLSANVGELQNILTDKKTRGIYGEVTLKHVVENVLGNNDRLYKLQYPFDSGRIADCVIFAPEPIGILAVDSKFPLEHYKQMIQSGLTESEQSRLSSLFVQDVKKHINAIADKYIIPNVTANEAIMFLPAEAIFAEINAYHSELMDYAAERHVWICSPTTLMATLTTIQMAVKNVEQSKNAQKIQEELNKLQDEFERYDTRWKNLVGHIDNVSRDVKDIGVTSKKISTRFREIEKVKFSDTPVDAVDVGTDE